MRLSRRGINSTTQLNDESKWIVKPYSDGYYIMTGYSSTDMYVGQSNVIKTGTTYYSNLTTQPNKVYIKNNLDGTKSVLNTSENKILSFSGSSIVWNNYFEGQIIQDSQKWTFETDNYLHADVNMDGVINSDDSQQIQLYLAHLISLDNKERQLADVDRDGYISVYDALRIQIIWNNIYTY